MGKGSGPVTAVGAADWVRGQGQIARSLHGDSSTSGRASRLAGVMAVPTGVERAVLSVDSSIESGGTQVTSQHRVRCIGGNCTICTDTAYRGPHTPIPSKHITAATVMQH